MARESHQHQEYLSKQVKEALRLWHDVHSDASPLGHLQIFRDEWRKHPSSIRQITNKILYHALSTLQESSDIRTQTEAELIKVRFLDNKDAIGTSQELNIGVQTVYNKQPKAIESLAAILSKMENEACVEYKKLQLDRLESRSYQNLVGVQSSINKLLALLNNAQPPWIIAIEGIGGIGKTSLADALMREVVEQNMIYDLGWVAARQQHFHLGGTLQTIDKPTLTPEALIEELAKQLFDDIQTVQSRPTVELIPMVRKHLHDIPHIIAIDNLETAADVSGLMAMVRQLINPTKFVLTSRVYVDEPHIHRFPVPELSHTDALILVRQEAQQRNLPELLSATDHDLMPIIETVGSNPLALRLVVGQMHLYPMDIVLQNLWDARGETIENLYTFIYQQIWSQLDEETRRVLITMPLITSSGATAAQISAINKMDELSVFRSLAKLVQFNIVDSRGGLRDKQYTIHNLTRTFLHEQVVRWQ